VSLKQLSVQFRDFVKVEDQLAGFCPLCRGLIRLSEMEMFYIPDRKEDFLTELRRKARELEDQKLEIRKDAIKRSRSKLMGDLFEQVRPYLPGFKYEPGDLRSIWDPVDFVSFNGLAVNRHVGSVTFLEIKTGRSALSDVQRSIRDAVENKKISFETVQVKPESLAPETAA
jgi:predicted Holliday junction resolvase-like endonuclease